MRQNIKTSEKEERSLALVSRHRSATVQPRHALSRLLPCLLAITLFFGSGADTLVAAKRDGAGNQVRTAAVKAAKNAAKKQAQKTKRAKKQARQRQFKHATRPNRVAKPKQQSKAKTAQGGKNRKQAAKSKPTATAKKTSARKLRVARQRAAQQQAAQAPAHEQTNSAATEPVLEEQPASAGSTDAVQPATADSEVAVETSQTDDLVASPNADDFVTRPDTVDGEPTADAAAPGYEPRDVVSNEPPSEPHPVDPEPAADPSPSAEATVPADNPAAESEPAPILEQEPAIDEEPGEAVEPEHVTAEVPATESPVNDVPITVPDETPVADKDVPPVPDGEEPAPVDDVDAEAPAEPSATPDATAPPEPAQVEAPVKDLIVEAISTDDAVVPGQHNRYRFRIANPSTQAVNARISATNSLSGWTSELRGADGVSKLPGAITLAGGESMEIVIVVSVPANAVDGEINNTSLTVSPEERVTPGDVGTAG